MGREVGQVPASTPTVPLAADLARLKRSLRLKTDVDPIVLELELRQPNGHARSVLFRQLLLLDVPWARPEEIEGARGSFRERWVLAWRAVLTRLAEEDQAHGLVRGVATRLLLEQGALDGGLGRLARRALSRAVPPPEASAWLEGLLRGSALVVLHQAELWEALDAWLGDLVPGVFEEQLPLVRRAFASFTPAERRRMGERVAALMGSSTLRRSESDEPRINFTNAQKTLAILQRIIGPLGANDG